MTNEQLPEIIDQTNGPSISNCIYIGDIAGRKLIEFSEDNIIRGRLGYLGLKLYGADSLGQERVVLWLSIDQATESAEEPSQTIMADGRLVVDHGKATVSIDGNDLGLTATEFKLLNFLTLNKEITHSQETLIDKVWGVKRPVNCDSVKTYIVKIRRKLDDLGWMVQTKRGLGYLLTDDTREKPAT